MRIGYYDELNCKILTTTIHNRSVLSFTTTSAKNFAGLVLFIEHQVAIFWQDGNLSLKYKVLHFCSMCTCDKIFSYLPFNYSHFQRKQLEFFNFSDPKSNGDVKFSAGLGTSCHSCIAYTKTYLGSGTVFSTFFSINYFGFLIILRKMKTFEESVNEVVTSSPPPRFRYP